METPHAGVTWSRQLESDALRESNLAGPSSILNSPAYKGRQSVSMYMDDMNASMKSEDAGTTMKIVTALRERCALLPCYECCPACATEIQCCLPGNMLNA